MDKTPLEVRPIGIIRTPFTSSEGVPIQPTKSDAVGIAEVNEEYVTGLKSLDGFSHIYLLYWFHRARPAEMEVKPYLDSNTHGLFSTRAPSRPNPIGISIVELIKVDGRIIHFRGADMLDGTPLLDIKPYVPDFDHNPDASSGWLSKSKIRESHDFHADDRFENR